MPDLAMAGALEPLDAYVDKYGYREELQTIAPTYRDNQMTFNDTIYSLPDDGDVFVFYYRKDVRSEEHTSELQSLMRISYAVFCLKKKNKTITLLITIILMYT